MLANVKNASCRIGIFSRMPLAGLVYFLFLFINLAYDSTINVDASNAFQTAAFRFGHSQVTTLLKFSDQMYRRKEELKYSKVSNVKS